MEESLVVYCVLCIEPDGTEITHIFSTAARAQQFADSGDRPHVLYDYEVDNPNCMGKPPPSLN